MWDIGTRSVPNNLKSWLVKIPDIDRRNALLPTSGLYKEKLLLQSEFNTLMTWKAEKNISKSRQVYYEHGDKAGRLLALCKSETYNNNPYILYYIKYLYSCNLVRILTQDYSKSTQ